MAKPKKKRKSHITSGNKKVTPGITDGERKKYTSKECMYEQPNKNELVCMNNNSSLLTGSTGFQEDSHIHASKSKSCRTFSASVGTNNELVMQDANLERDSDWTVKYKGLLQMSPNVVVLKLREGISTTFLEEKDVTPDQFALFIKTTSFASSYLHKESLFHLLQEIFSLSYSKKLKKLILQIRNRKDLVKTFFMDFSTILEKFMVIVPTLAGQMLPDLVGCCIVIIEVLGKSDDSSWWEMMSRKFSKILEEVDKQNHKWLHKLQLNLNENITSESNEDFRMLSTVPKGDDISGLVKPQVWKNITKGKFRNGDHYLDTHFRLLREDFLRPLRSGVEKYKKRVPWKNRDVRIYEDVRIVGSRYKKGELLHYIQLKLPKNFRVENSKQLMFGNLLCFSNDNFQNILCASITDTYRDDLRRGQLGVKFEHEAGLLNNDTSFVVAETKSYFEAYKHTLAALKEMEGSMIPFYKHIICVESQIKKPEYLKPDTTYDMSVLNGKGPFSHLKDVIVRGKEWPSSEELGLDESQHNALRSALTRELAIIQGPPGTGKTFLGLKIAQVLLYNKHWQNQRKGPILCVCYTNHALDQFLEGMLSFTKRLLRVGSRSKSENLEKYQISRVCKFKRFNFDDIYYGKCADIRQFESCLSACHSGLKMCTDLKGIVSLDVLSDVIPWRINAQLENNLSDWLLSGFDFSLQKEDLCWKSSLNGDPQTLEKNEIEDGFWDIVSDIEEERQIFMEEEHYEVPKGKPIVAYETCEETLERNCQHLEEKLQNNPSDADTFWSLVVKRKRLRVLRYGLQIASDQNTDMDNVDIWKLDFTARWSLYRHWIKRLYAKILAMKKQYEIILQSHNGVLKEISDARYLDIMKEADVVGMTLTGAAKYRHILQALAPRIVIVEEAAEILEAHVMAAISPSCQHLIMIGDHQQLRPSTNAFELATKYGLETSLFERMINNNVQYETLASQHRMRPTISELLVPSIYPSLQDDPSVHDYPDVMGLEKNVFFVTHQYPEKTPINDDSYENEFEGQFIMALCRHLMLQGYSPNDITVLTPYTGQFFLLRKLQRECHKCDGVRISIVDAFQGEESNIILLSLVRSNKEGNVGFLRIDNRVCVALSRAKHGFYLVGNMNILRSSSNLWKTIELKLKQTGSIGESLTLKCVNHPYNLSRVETAYDFFIKSPNGGCHMPCLKPLPSCGHPCQQPCHLQDMNHKEIMCLMKCDRVCERNHPCLDLCWMKCVCKIMVEKELPCGHVHPVPCSVEVSRFHCPTVVERVLPLCQHVQQMDCSDNPSMVVCKTPCKKILACGHQCTMTCHLAIDPDHSKFKCRQPCKRRPHRCILDHECPRYCYEQCGLCEVAVSKMLPCGHEAALPCHLPEGCFVCKEPRNTVLPCGHEQEIKCFQAEIDVHCTTLCTKTLPCGHEQETMCHLLKEATKCLEPCMKTHPCGHHCQRKCFEQCLSCQVIVKKVINSCGHEVDIECSVEATRKYCKSTCKIQLACGHLCQNYCSDPCTRDCTEDVASTCVSGHLFFLPCYVSSSVSTEEAWTYCNEPCKAQLECGHTCTGSCSLCFHGQIHIPCTRKCRRQLLCRHKCDGDCSSTCLPCQEKITFKCPHFVEKVNCGNPRKPCNKPCTWKCQHLKCRNKCGADCSRPGCEEPCPKFLQCGHPCIGFCGDPCPTLCRICNRGELNVRSRNIEKARFVLLEDCDHVIEVEKLENWLQKSKYVGITCCPQCKHPIYNNRRYMHIVSSKYKETRSIMKTYITYAFQKKEVEIVINKVFKKNLFRKQLMAISNAISLLSYKQPKLLSEINKHYTILFQAKFLLKSCEIYNAIKCSTECLKYFQRIVWHVMNKKIVSHQYTQEVSCELQRQCYLAFYHKSCERNSEVEDILYCNLRLEKFNPEMEDRLKRIMKCSASRRLTFHLYPGLRFGTWLLCPEGHPYYSEYERPYGKNKKEMCNVEMYKVIPECQHKIYLKCSVTPTKKRCTAQCIIKLECGHPCQARCCDECTPQCLERVVHPQNCPRGHGVIISCSISQTVDEETLWQSCESVCGEILHCGHSCSGLCGQCRKEGTHSICRESCNKELPCGHRCQDLCYEPCGRCRQRCMKRCKHKRCSNLCGVKCDPCLSPCSWRCKHHKCEKQCRELCSRPPCEEPCPKKLKCGHYCVGFCGDPCPDLCRTCNKDELQEILAQSSSLKFQEVPSLELNGTLNSTKENENNARFVLLEDCKHIVEVKSLEYHLEYSRENLQIPRCSLCQQPIYNNLRYQRFVWYSSPSTAFMSTWSSKKGLQKQRH
ncbi:NFX1-type zinc finger-containing protein 1-like [Oratosquilla oratoria]|uniref:NFX1-type zinc finger-containing protein 1-like n=1 Tax=Oratosquilla oratoria TaxID=337810 RepID=UPI003F776EA6